MKRSLLLIFSCFFLFQANAQTTHDVVLKSNSFTPSSLTILVGDIVRFDNQEGTHWVDGTTSTFPSNPVSFDNQSQSGSGWVYSETFNTAGFYNYRCGIHTSMTGTINVVTTLDIEESSVDLDEVELFPNPATDKVKINGNITVESVDVYSLVGKKVNSPYINEELLVDELSKGIYLVKIKTTSGELITKRLQVTK